MEVMSVEAPNVVNMALAALDEGGIVMHPTETCYGFAVDIFNEQALSKLYHMKNMPTDKPVSILVDSMEMAEEYGVFSAKAKELAKKYWPGPFTIMVPRSESLPAFFNKGHNFVAMRISSNDFCQKMVESFVQPVSTTSANKSGRPQLYMAKKMPGLDFVVNAGPIDKNPPSTIVKVDGDKVEVIREGALVI